MSTSITSIPLTRDFGSDDHEDGDEWEAGAVGINAELVPSDGTVSLLKDVNLVATHDGRLLEITKSGEVIRKVTLNDVGEPAFDGTDVQARSNP